MNLRHSNLFKWIKQTIKPCIYELFWVFIMVRCNVNDTAAIFYLSLFLWLLMVDCEFLLLFQSFLSAMGKTLNLPMGLSGFVSRIVALENAVLIWVLLRVCGFRPTGQFFYCEVKVVCESCIDFTWIGDGFLSWPCMRRLEKYLSLLWRENFRQVFDGNSNLKHGQNRILFVCMCLVFYGFYAVSGRNQCDVRRILCKNANRQYPWNDRQLNLQSQWFCDVQTVHI